MNELIRLQQFIDEKGWSKAEFARRMSIVPQDVNKYLAGKVQTKNLYVKLMENGCDIHWLMTGEATNNADAQLLYLLKKKGITSVEQLEKLFATVEAATTFARQMNDTVEILGSVEELGGYVRVRRVQGSPDPREKQGTVSSKQEKEKKNQKPTTK